MSRGLEWYHRPMGSDTGIRPPLGAEHVELASHPDRHVRWGTARALAEQLAADPEGEEAEELVDRLAHALADPDRDLRQQAFAGLERVRKAGHALFPSSGTVEELVGRFDRSPDLAEILYLWVVGSRRVAEAVHARLARGGQTLTPLGERLREICAEALAGRPPRPCPICVNLDRFEYAGSEEDLPRETRLLVSVEGEIRACPQCGTRYNYGRDEYDSDAFGVPRGTWERRPGRWTARRRPALIWPRSAASSKRWRRTPTSWCIHRRGGCWAGSSPPTAAPRRDPSASASSSGAGPGAGRPRM